MNRQVKRGRDPMGANARGAAFIASVGLGQLSFEDIPGLIEYDRVFDPKIENTSIYNKFYEIFVTSQKLLVPGS